MATIEEVVATGVLDLFELPFFERRSSVRPLYVSTEFMEWGDDTPALHDEALALGGRTLFEHLLQTLCDFRCSVRPAQVGELRRMMPTTKGVWSLHSPGLRVYGWVPRPHSFIAVIGALESATKADKQLNDACRDKVIAFAKQNSIAGTMQLGDILALFPHKN